MDWKIGTIGTHPYLNNAETFSFEKSKVCSAIHSTGNQGRDFKKKRSSFGVRRSAKNKKIKTQKLKG